MRRATSIIRQDAAASRVPVDTITLPRADRYRRRIALTTDRGQAFLLDLAEATVLTHGDLLLLDDNCVIEVRAAAEPLLEIHARDAVALARIAWHIGNRHTPAEVTATALYIQPDHVLEAMVIGLGAHVHHVARPFDPEGGAYGGKGPLQHGHHHHGHHHHGEAPPLNDQAPQRDPERAASRSGPAIWQPD